MKIFGVKKLIIIIQLFLFFNQFHAQEKEALVIALPDKSIQSSLYSKIKVIDSREDTLSVGVFKNKSYYIDQSLQTQFQNILNALVVNSSKDGELVLYIKRFHFSGANSGVNYFHFQAFLFSQNDNGKYSYFDKVDEVVRITGKKNGPAETISSILTNFLSKNLVKTTTYSNQFTFSDLLSYNEVEKNRFPLFSSDNLNDGIYENFIQFRNQTPTKIIIEDVNFAADPDKIYKVYYRDADNKLKTVDRKKYYAIVFRGEAYIFMEADNNFTKLYRRQNDFYFVGNINSNTNGNELFYSMFFGLAGGLLYYALNDTKTKYEFELDYFNGNFIPIKEIKRKY